MNKVRFATMFNPHPVQASPTGEAIYEWEYLDESNKLQKEKKNIYEYIQSFARQVDYKLRIKNDEEVSDNKGGLYVDITKFGHDFSSINDYIAGLVKDLRSSAEKHRDSESDRKDSPKDTETPPESKET